MPYTWKPSPEPNQDHWQLELWPYRSLLRRDFVIFFGSTFALIGLPLIALVGSGALWVIMVFFAIVFAGLWGAVHKSYRQGEILEECTASPESVTLTRHNPDGQMQIWRANRYWATLHLHPTGGPVENYLTIRGGDREVEIGAFLNPAERSVLFDELNRALRLDRPGSGVFSEA